MTTNEGICPQYKMMMVIEPAATRDPKSTMRGRREEEEEETNKKKKKEREIHVAL